jgi:hypothetical protein
MKYLKKRLLFIPLIWVITGCQQSEPEQQPANQTEVSQQQVAADENDESAAAMVTPPENEESDQPLSIDEFNDAIYEVVQDSIQDAVENAVEDEVAKGEQQK